MGTRVYTLAAAIALLGTLAFVGPVVAETEPVCFDGHRVVRVQVDTKADIDLLQSMTDDVWSHSIVRGHLDVRVTPEQFARLETSGLNHTVLIEDVQALIDEVAAGGVGDGPFDDYMTYPQVLDYLNTLVALRPDLAETFTLPGQTIEQRNIVGIRVTGPGGGEKPGVLYHGAEHAREWITVPVSLYVADQLIRLYDTDPRIHQLVDRIEWFIVPVFNVDGYVYTHDVNRMWRKNRRNNGGGIYGVDINRNWSVGWGGPGSSSDPGSETYRGAAPFSEPETQALRDFFLDHPNIVTHNDVHSYGQLLMWPWGYQPDLTPDEPEFRFVGENMADIVRGVHGMTYDIGPVYHAIYPASGVSVDWGYGEAGVFSFTFELRDNGQYGFVLPPAQIIPNCEEIFPALLFQAQWFSAAVRVEFPEGLPTHLEPGVPTTLAVRITDGFETVDPNGATLYVRTTAGGSFDPYPIVHLGGHDFEATFPPRGCGDDSEFYIEARGLGGGITYSPFAAPDEFYSAPIGVLEVLLHDNFETQQGWTVENFNLASGAWVRVDPIGTFSGGQPVQPEDDNPTGTGTMCYVTGQGTPGGSVGEADVDGGPTILTSPIIELADFPEARISYYRWFYNDDNDDTLVVEVTNDDGAQWVQVEATGHDPGWNLHDFRVADYVTPTDLVRVRFSTADNPNNSITEAGIDDVEVSTLDCGIILGDLDEDGDVDLFDFELFLGCYTGPEAGPYDPGCERGDFDGDLDIDRQDFAGFEIAYTGSL